MLTFLYVLGACFGTFSIVVLMQTAWHSDADQLDPNWIRNLRRASLMLLALSMLYGADYVAREIAAPWLPNVLLVWAMDLCVVTRIASIRMRDPTVRSMMAAGFIRVK